MPPENYPVSEDEAIDANVSARNNPHTSVTVVRIGPAANAGWKPSRLSGNGTDGVRRIQPLEISVHPGPPSVSIRNAGRPSWVLGSSPLVAPATFRRTDAEKNNRRHVFVPAASSNDPTGIRTPVFRMRT